MYFEDSDRMIEFFCVRYTVRFRDSHRRERKCFGAGLGLVLRPHLACRPSPAPPPSTPLRLCAFRATWPLVAQSRVGTSPILPRTSVARCNVVLALSFLLRPSMAPLFICRIFSHDSRIGRSLVAPGMCRTPQKDLKMREVCECVPPGSTPF